MICTTTELRQQDERAGRELAAPSCSDGLRDGLLRELRLQ